MADSRFETLVFDLGGVLVLHDNDLLYRRLGAQCAAPDAADRIRAAALDPRINSGERTIADLYAGLCRDIGYRRAWQDFLADWSSHFTIDWAMLQWVQRLAARQRVFLFSNTNAAHWDYLVAATGGALSALEAYLSFEIGDVKPRPSAFRRVAARAGIEPRRALFIDDVAENVAGALETGFHGHVFTSQENLARCLADPSAASPDIGYRA